MATATRMTEITITLVMDKEEAEFLRDFLYDDDVVTVSDEHKAIRESLFIAVDTGLKKRK